MVNGECRLPSFSDWRAIVFENGEQEEFVLFDDTPLIFKLRNNWTGEGRKTCGITKGYFIVIAPNEWERTGHVPVEPVNCTDTGFTAHYFHRNGTEPTEDIGGFCECAVVTTSGFELIGQRVFDDSEDGDLFVGTVPKLKLFPNVAWVRVGEEAENGWKGENFEPDERTLAKVLNGRQGRFFIRVYDDTKLLDSGEFRYLRNLKEIRVNGDLYTENTCLVPPSTGYPPTKVRFIGVDGATVRPILPLELTHAEAQGGDLIVEPHPKGDDISCTLKSDTGLVDVGLNLPRTWWRMKRDGSETGEWRDTPLTMTRQEFREHAHANATMRLRLPRRVKSVRVGFDDELKRMYRPVKGENDISVPLAHFIDYSQIDRRLNEAASLKFECLDKAISALQCGCGVILTLIRVSADPVPAIISFMCELATVPAGKQATLHWATQNAEAGGVVIDPEIGAVESSGSLEVEPSKTTTYTLRLMVSGMDNVTKTATVTVGLPPEKAIARVRRAGGGWRYGKGFGYGELRAAGLPAADATRRSMPIDKRRRSTHGVNIETIGNLIDA